MLPAGLPAAEITPLTRVHAHNDYQHRHPLFDALEQGFCSVEADVHLVSGRLLVAHLRLLTREARTLESLYLDPLTTRVRRNGGSVFPGGPEFVLLVELKDDWRVSYPTLRRVLEGYREILTTYEKVADGHEVRQPRAVRVIVTGHRSRAMLAGESVRYVSLDGGLGDLKAGASADLVPWVSADWSDAFRWRGHGVFPADQQARLTSLVARAHEQGRRVRFWGSPDQAKFWRVLWNNGVDLINTDDLEGAGRFVRGLP